MTASEPKKQISLIFNANQAGQVLLFCTFHQMGWEVQFNAAQKLLQVLLSHLCVAGLDVVGLAVSFKLKTSWERRCLFTSLCFHFAARRHFQILQVSAVFVYLCVFVCTLFHQEICLHSVESLTIPPSFFQLLLAVCQPSLFLPHGPLVILVNVLQLLIRTLEDLSGKQPRALVTRSLPLQLLGLVSMVA